MSLKSKLDESYRHIKPYISKKETPKLIKMCESCEKWNGKEHDYSECKHLPCFEFFLAYEYLRWSDSYE